ncbi:MAG: SLBB domain-containing protein [Cyanobacteriota bacterium]|nr:SLBB domain-containing protein [Cyanobacteriota bacterium]
MRVSRLAGVLVALLPLIQLSASLQAAEALPPPASKTAPQTDSEAQAANVDAYVLGAGDTLQLTFISSSYASLGGSFELLNDGSTTLPMIGTVVLDGLTLNQANRWLMTLYRRYLRRPELTLRVLSPRPLQISVVGEVQAPGLYVFSPRGEGASTGGKSVSVTSSGLPTVVSALQRAGGITLNANLREVRLQRKLPGTPNQLKEIQLDLVSLLQRGDKRQNPFLFDGDTILLSRAPAPPPEEVLNLAATNLNPVTIAVNVVGEVKNPGTLQIPTGTPLMKALLMAGGPLPYRANRNNVELVRINRNGTATFRRYSVDYRLAVSGPRNPPLKDGDSIIVNRSVLATGTDTLNAVTQPLTGLVNILALVEVLRNTSNNNN